MNDDNVTFQMRLSKFESRHTPLLNRQLGAGRDGIIIATERQTAVKFFARRDSWLRERHAYRVLQDLKISEIAGHQVPQYLGDDEELLTIEMTIVAPPFLLDFASAYPAENAPDFSEDVWCDWREQKAAQFEARWPAVERILAEFTRATDLVLLDVNPGNVRFEIGETETHE